MPADITAGSNETGVFMKIVVVGPGAFGIKHLDGLKNIDSAEVVGLVGRNAAKTQAVARERTGRRTGLSWHKRRPRLS